MESFDNKISYYLSNLIRSLYYNLVDSTKRFLIEHFLSVCRRTFLPI